VHKQIRLQERADQPPQLAHPLWSLKLNRTFGVHKRKQIRDKKKITTADEHFQELARDIYEENKNIPNQFLMDNKMLNSTTGPLIR
jgi:hypothetical protein